MKITAEIIIIAIVGVISIIVETMRYPFDLRSFKKNMLKLNHKSKYLKL